MSRKGGSKSLKRVAAPRAWRLPRKEKAWARKPRAGPHPVEYSLPLASALQALGKAGNAREAEKLVKAGEVHVDGRARRDPRLAVGFMDVVFFPTTREAFRVVFDSQGKLVLRPEDETRRSFKLCRIERKTTAPGGRTQLGLHDGRSLLAEREAGWTVGDVLKVGLPDQKILESFHLRQGSAVTVIRGKHAGCTGRVEAVEGRTVRVRTDGEGFTTLASYVFVVGGEKAEVVV